jgi:hypothetical protein
MVTLQPNDGEIYQDVIDLGNLVQYSESCILWGEVRYEALNFPLVVPIPLILLLV